MSETPPPPPPPPPGEPPAAPPPPGGSLTSQGPTLVTRFLARIVDALVVGIPLGIVLLVLPLGQFLEQILGTVIGYGYFVYMEGNQGATIGKNVMKLKVQRADGQPMTQDVAIQRNLWMLVGALGAIPVLSLISLAVVIYLAVTISGDAEGRGWHDRHAGAIVVAA